MYVYGKKQTNTLRSKMARMTLKRVTMVFISIMVLQIEVTCEIDKITSPLSQKLSPPILTGW